MAQWTIEDVAKALQAIDFAMLNTRTDDGGIAARPMSNNAQVDYDGDSYFFSNGDTRTVRDIARDANVGLSYAGKPGLFGKPGVFIAVEGKAELIRDKAAFAAHWTKDLDYWFKDGIETPGLVMIKVSADRAHYWDGEDEGEIVVRAGTAA